MNYHAYELAHSLMSPARMAAQGLKMQLTTPFNPWSLTPMGKAIAAACDVFESVTRRYGKPAWDIDKTRIFGLDVPVTIEPVVKKPFCTLLHFVRDPAEMGKRYDPKVLIVAPMSGHYATLLRGTVEAMLPEHDVYITDWLDARDIPVTEGRFDLDDYIDYLIEFVEYIGPRTHVLAVCQPSVPALAATAVMAAEDHPVQPLSLILMGGPIDTRRNPTAVNKLAEEKSIDWFEQNVISTVPFPNAGFTRRVYPGFVQLTGFMTMNLERHTKAHLDLYHNLVKGDCDSVQQHRDFYEEYLAVMDLTAEFYLQTVNTVFQRHALPKGEMTHRGTRVDCSAIRQTALFTVEGERDDISGLGQTEAAQDLCTSIPIDERYHYMQPGVGHYGVFNGTRWRTEIQPRIREFIRTIEFKRKTTPQQDRVGSEPGPSTIGDGGARFGLPYRTLQHDRENVVDWTEVKAAATSKR
ncbi:MAG: polyhydroxyalkanoate depolymerase [Hyphomicrobiaceae bacterium]|nr:polyhydroxyalkanoate depolymerase [Hyphomicrobiaceae bacterium]